MTRIDCVPVEELSNAHLQSNYKELPRAFGYIRARISKNLPLVDRQTPPKYTMGQGHVKFFYDKFLWLAKRYREVHREMVARGFKPSYSENYNISDIVNSEESLRHTGRWKPSQADIEVSRARIKERISEKPQEHSWTLRTPPGYARAIIATPKLK